MQRELNAIADPGVIPIPQDLESRRRGILQINLAENLKRIRGHLPGIRRKPMSNFEAVLIGLMLHVTRVNIRDRRGDKTQKQKQDGINRKRRQIARAREFSTRRNVARSTAAKSRR